jgi:DNA polymerase-3 subunit delta'
LSQPPQDADTASMFAPAPPTSLDCPADHPLLRRSRALGEPRLFLLRCGYDAKKERYQDVISVEETRGMRSFFTMSAADGGHRAAIIDSVDDMTQSAANALLKTLEEPPARATLILISHQPAKLLPTIRSRCRELRAEALGPEDMTRALAQAGATVPDGQGSALAELAAGSVGAAIRMVGLDGLELYSALIAAFANAPQLSRPLAIKLAQVGAAKGGAAQFDLIVSLIDFLLARLARAAATSTLPPEAASGEIALIRRLASRPDTARQWADLAQSLAVRARRGKAVNLDPFALLMDMVLQIEQTAKATA